MSRARRESVALRARHKQFVVSIPTADMVREMEYCGTHSGSEADKWTVCGFTPIPGDVVDVPLIAECPVNYECVVEQQLSFERQDGSPGEHEVMIGRIVRVHAHDGCLVDRELVHRAGSIARTAAATSFGLGHLAVMGLMHYNVSHGQAWVLV